MFNDFYFSRHIVTKGRNGENWAFLNLSCSYKNVETHLNLWEFTPRILLFEITIKINTLWRHLIRENRENKACSLIRTYGMILGPFVRKKFEILKYWSYRKTFVLKKLRLDELWLFGKKNFLSDPPKARSQGGIFSILG